MINTVSSPGKYINKEWMNILEALIRRDEQMYFMPDASVFDYPFETSTGHLTLAGVLIHGLDVAYLYVPNDFADSNIPSPSGMVVLGKNSLMRKTALVALNFLDHAILILIYWKLRLRFSPSFYPFESAAII